MSYKSKYDCEGLELLYSAILELKTKEECCRFFEDLCTPKEIKNMSQRINVASLLFHKVSYQIIQEQTHASTATIGKVNNSLHYGSDGYRQVFFRLKDKFSFASYFKKEDNEED